LWGAARFDARPARRGGAELQGDRGMALLEAADDLLERCILPSMITVRSLPWT
jgi:hypothetical protein